MTPKKQSTINSFFKSSNKSSSDVNKELQEISKLSKETEGKFSTFTFNKNENNNNQKNKPNEIDKNINQAKRTLTETESPLNSSKRRHNSKSQTKLTPLEKQIIELTEANPDKVLLIQVGYKYRSFGESAKIVARALNIMYIENDSDARFSYCSFPDVRLHINLQRILNVGVKVGVVKQMESAIVKEVEKSSKSSDLMKREITGVYTKGTYMGDEFIESNLVPNTAESENPSYIICIYENLNDKVSTLFGLVAVQPLTGEIIYDSFTDNLTREELETRLLYLRPSEVIVVNKENDISSSTLKSLKLINRELKFVHKQEHSDFKLNLEPHLIEYYTINFPTSIQICISELIQYLTEFKLNNIFSLPQNITNFKDSRKYMILPANTLSALEIFTNSTNSDSTKGTLVWLLNHTRTRFGSRLLHKWISKPLIERNKIEERYQAIEDLASGYNHVIDSLMGQLNKIGKNLDLEELLIKIHYSSTLHSTRINRKQVFLMIETFNDLRKLVKSFEKSVVSLNLNSGLLKEIFQDLLEASKSQVVENLTNMLNPSYLLNDSKDINDQKITFFNLKYQDGGFDKIINVKNEIKNVEFLLDEELKKIKQLLKRPQLKYITSNKEPYLIEIRNGKQVEELPSSFIKISGTNSVSRFRSKEVSELYKLLQYHQELLVQSCDEAFQDYLLNIDSQYGYFHKIVKHLANFDCLLSLTAASNLKDRIKPKLTDELIIDVKNAKNPIIEQIRENYVSNDINIQYDSNRALIITGPNMGGKSCYVRTVALLVIMTQIGCYIPCESASVGIFDSIFIRMGATDNILKGNSTFMTEMLECGHIINRITNRSLIILDEIGRGTGTIDGIALAYSILKYLIELPQQPLLLFITHYPSISVLEYEYPKIVKNYHMGFEEIQTDSNFPEVVFLYTLESGVVNNSYGLNVAKLANIPNGIIGKAFEISEELKNKIESRDQVNFINTVKGVLDNDVNALNSLTNYLN
ncbi:unnamed protein product [Candida verbasci]|uniref:DNA mismatch repair protein MSH3 n=1 Tax=Candida verbasci TaxID=1227364 RepID=A0A9W4TWV4_9ASCO|nr:unnamed protein product [Candida verbasci]